MLTVLANILDALKKPTPIYGLPLWVVIAIAGGATIILLVVALLLCITCRRRRRRADSVSAAGKGQGLRLHSPNPKDVPVIAHHNRHHAAPAPVHAPAPAEHPIDIGGKEQRVMLAEKYLPPAPAPAPAPLSSSVGWTARDGLGSTRGKTPSTGSEGASHLLWGHWFTLREMEEATRGLAKENVIGNGAYGVVYRGVLWDNSKVAIKRLLNNRGQAEQEFKKEVETIGRIRHKNLVSLLGYCVEGPSRMLVYEYVDNGNLDHWLHHEDADDISPLTWDVRMKIMLETAKALAYLHEGLEPKVVHRDVKASNILLDQQWNPKVSDFGLAKLLQSEMTHVTTRVMGTFGYVAPEYASTGMLNDRSDVYSFGVLLMEIISGRAPMDYTKPPGEVNLVEWFKTMVGDKKTELIVDPRLAEKPPAKALKRILLVALRCVDPDSRNRPKMGQVVHMLEMDEFDDRKQVRETVPLRSYNQREEDIYSRHDRQTRWQLQDRGGA